MALKILTRTEELIMKCVWDASEDLTVAQVIEICKEKYQKSYAPSTVNTFFLHLSQKGYVEIYKIGHAYHFKQVVSAQEYMKQTFENLCGFYYEGSVAKMVEAAIKCKRLSAADKKDLRAVLEKI